MNITVAGTGYVGLSLAVLLAQKNAVTAVDIVSEKVRLINEKCRTGRIPERKKSESDSHHASIRGISQCRYHHRSHPYEL